MKKVGVVTLNLGSSNPLSRTCVLRGVDNLATRNLGTKLEQQTAGRRANGFA